MQQGMKRGKIGQHKTAEYHQGGKSSRQKILGMIVFALLRVYLQSFQHLPGSGFASQTTLLLESLHRISARHICNVITSDEANRLMH